MSRTSGVRKGALRISVLLACLTVIPVTPNPAQGAAASAQVKLIRPIGPPGASTTLKGRGFGASEIVDILFDTDPLSAATTDPSGKFSKEVTVPVTALPGEHAVTATGETSGLTASTTFTVRTDWPKFHFDLANSGSNPYENVLSPDNVGGLKVAWKVTGRDSVNYSPVVVNGIVYVGAGPFVMALDAATGARIWQRETSVSASNVAVANGIVYTGSLGHVLFAYDALTGATVFRAGGPTGSPTVADGVVYAGDNFGTLYAIDALTGAQVWTASVGFAVGVNGAPAVADGVVYVGANANGAGDTAFAFDAATGALVWKVPVGDVYGAPAVVGGIVYLGSLDHHVYALNAVSGSVLWAAPTAGGVESSPAVDSGRVYVGCDDKRVYALDAGTGLELWTYATGQGIQLGSPSVANQVVYVGSEDESIYALDASNGERLWAYQTGSIINTSAAVVDGVVYMGSFDRKLYAFHLPQA